PERGDGLVAPAAEEEDPSFRGGELGTPGAELTGFLEEGPRARLVSRGGHGLAGPHEAVEAGIDRRAVSELTEGAVAVPLGEGGPPRRRRIQGKAGQPPFAGEVAHQAHDDAGRERGEPDGEGRARQEIVCAWRRHQ